MHYRIQLIYMPCLHSLFQKNKKRIVLLCHRLYFSILQWDSGDVTNYPTIAFLLFYLEALIYLPFL